MEQDKEKIYQDFYLLLNSLFLFPLTFSDSDSTVTFLRVHASVNHITHWIFTVLSYGEGLIPLNLYFTYVTAY